MTNPALIERAFKKCQSELMEWSLPRYGKTLRSVEADLNPNYRFPWRVCESPGICTQEILDADVQAISRLLSPYFTSSFREIFQQTCPDRFRRPDNDGWFPRYLATDFQRSVDPETGEWVYGVPEIQSFPSNLLLMPRMVRAWMSQRDDWEPRSLIPLDGIDSLDDYIEWYRPVVLGDADPDVTFVVELDPHDQKTAIDQMLYTHHYGVRVANLRDLEVCSRTGEVTVSRVWGWGDAGAAYLDLDKPQLVRRAHCRALPEELEDVLSSYGLGEEKIEALFQSTLDRGTMEWPVHPQDFFVVWKGTLLNNPHHEHPLFPVNEDLLSKLQRRGWHPSDGVIKPTSRAGGEGLMGFDGKVTEENLRVMAERQASQTGLSHAEAVRRLLLWQKRYPTSHITARDGDGSSKDRYQEMRFMWVTDTSPSGSITMRLAAGMVRWAKPGRPANAQFATTTYTGTHGVAFPPGAHVELCMT